MLKRLFGWIGLAAALAFGSMGTVASAQTIIVGGPGGANFDDRCPEGAYLVGFDATTGKDMNQIMPICQKFANGHAVGATFKLRTWGTYEYDGGPFAAADAIRCPADMAVQGMQIQVSHVALVHAVALRCRNPNAHDYKMTGQSGSGFGAAAYEKPVDCGGGAIANGLIGRYGSLVDALGLDCKVIAAPARPPLPLPQAGQTGTNPPPPGGVATPPRPGQEIATAVQSDTVYKNKSGDQSPANVVCKMYPGDAGTVISSGPYQWLELFNISGRCNGQRGFVWNQGELTIR